jgi:hypothetical protein
MTTTVSWAGLVLQAIEEHAGEFHDGRMENEGEGEIAGEARRCLV